MNLFRKFNSPVFQLCLPYYVVMPEIQKTQLFTVNSILFYESKEMRRYSNILIGFNEGFIPPSKKIISEGGSLVRSLQTWFARPNKRWERQNSSPFPLIHSINMFFTEPRPKNYESSREGINGKSRYFQLFQPACYSTSPFVFSANAEMH